MKQILIASLELTGFVLFMVALWVSIMNINISRGKKDGVIKPEHKKLFGIK